MYPSTILLLIIIDFYILHNFIDVECKRDLCIICDYVKSKTLIINTYRLIITIDKRYSIN